MKAGSVMSSLKEAISPKCLCCFCGEPVPKNALVGINVDLGDNQTQFMSDHGLCLQERLHPSVPLLAPEEMQND